MNCIPIAPDSVIVSVHEIVSIWINVWHTHTTHTRSRRLASCSKNAGTCSASMDKENNSVVCVCVYLLHSRCSHDVQPVSQAFLMKFPHRDTCTPCKRELAKNDPISPIDFAHFTPAKGCWSQWLGLTFGGFGTRIDRGPVMSCSCFYQCMIL